MAYRLSPTDDDLAAFLRRIVGEQLAKATEALAGPPDPTSIHEARRAVKKVRAAVRLLRGSFPSSGAANSDLRNAARLISGLRDRTALIETLNRVEGHHEAEGLDPRALNALRGRLIEGRDAAEAQSAEEGALEAARGSLVAIRERSLGWHLDEQGWAALEPGIERVYRRGRKAAEEVRAEGDDPGPVHDWRKRVKEHRYHTRLLAPIWPGPLGARAAALHDLSDALGAWHDLDVLRTAIGKSDIKRDAALELLAALDRIAALDLRRAHVLAAPLYAPKPPALLREWAAAWAVRFR